MSVRHRNIFFYFRGRSKVGASAAGEEVQQHQQIENNTTKAPINSA
jgi:hypothetical protein